jgi:hypothetical protein
MFNEKRKRLIEALSSEQQDRLKKGKTALSDSGDSIGQNLSELKKVQDYLYQIKDDIQNEANSVDWDQNASDILRKVKLAEIEQQETSSVLFPKLLKLPYKLGIAAVTFLVMGFIFLYLMEKNGLEDERLIVPGDSMERMEKTMAKNETVEYLQQSSMILSSVSSMSTRKLDNSALRQNAEHAKNLLLKKKYLNRDLNNYELSNAQSVCNQVEYLLYDISQIKNPSDIESLNNLKNLIQNKKIMLKIKLVQSELVNNEVFNANKT